MRRERRDILSRPLLAEGRSATSSFSKTSLTLYGFMKILRQKIKIIGGSPRDKQIPRVQLPGYFSSNLKKNTIHMGETNLRFSSPTSPSFPCEHSSLTAIDSTDRRSEGFLKLAFL